MALLFSGVVHAQSAQNISIENFSHRQDGVDRVFDITLLNTSDVDLRANGRLVVLNVYDTAPPISLPLQNLLLEAGTREVVSVIWSNAPFLGQARTLLVIDDGVAPPTVGSYTFWLVPWVALLVIIGILIVALAGFMLVHTLLHRRKGKKKPSKKKEAVSQKGPVKDKKEPEPKKKEKKRKKRAPSGMVFYTTEFDDTVVTIAERFGVTWEDIVRANKLKPPYDLQKGKDILIPKHEIRHEEEEKGEKKP